jgi:hypothetical protein
MVMMTSYTRETDMSSKTVCGGKRDSAVLLYFTQVMALQVIAVNAR